jgi:hypothetical protein
METVAKMYDDRRQDSATIKYIKYIIHGAGVSRPTNNTLRRGITHRHYAGTLYYSCHYQFERTGTLCHGCPLTTWLLFDCDRIRGYLRSKITPESHSSASSSLAGDPLHLGHAPSVACKLQARVAVRSSFLPCVQMGL